jgi:hypothetical protein
MTTSDPEARERSKRVSIRRYIPATILVPLVGASLGIDGGPIFQILAVENLGLSAAAIGLAFGLGVVSLPIQLYASRFPIERARTNVQIFLVLAALQAWVLAVLVGAGATGGLATVALGVTVTAEISLSVFLATAWQPLLASGLDTYGRQRLNSTWPAVARGVLAGAVVLFAALDDTGRSIFLAVIGALSIATAIGLNAIDAPPPAPAAAAATTSREATALAPATRIALVVFAAVNIGAVPLWLVYLDEVLWPTANLGAVAAVQTISSMAALLAWRPTDGDVTLRALVASVATLVAAAAVALLDGPVGSSSERAVVVLATALVAGGTTTVRIAMLEAAHRIVRPANTVRAFTLIDVVASTSLQAGLLVGGLLITASTGAGAGFTDVYRGFVVITSAITIPAILWFRKRSSEDDG